MMNTGYYASYVLTGEGGLVWYAFGSTPEAVTEGASGMDCCLVLPCTAEAYRLACLGQWSRLRISGAEGSEAVTEAGEGEGTPCLNQSAPVVRCVC